MAPRFALLCDRDLEWPSSPSRIRGTTMVDTRLIPPSFDMQYGLEKNLDASAGDVTILVA